MTLVTTSEEVFACYRRSCAPPPVGRGGSNKGGRRGGDAARRAGIAKAKEAGVYSNKKKFFNKSEEEQDVMIHAAVKRAGQKALFKHRGKKAKKQPNEFIDKDTAFDKYRALQQANKRKKSPKA